MTGGLTRFSPAAGCACKLPWSELAEVVGLDHPAAVTDAASVHLAPGLMLVHSVDFGAPIVDDPETAGRIAAVHAMSDLFAVGARPVAGDLILEVPRSMPQRDQVGATLRHAMAEALIAEGVTSIGGHTTLGAEVRIGAAVSGVLDGLRRHTAGARVGDVVVLSKPIGVGLSVNAQQLLDGSVHGSDEWVAWAKRSNRVASDALTAVACSTCTDVTGFGLLGAALAVATASAVRVVLDFERVPLHASARPAVEAGVFSALAEDTLFRVAEGHVFGRGQGEQLTLASPETSGGLLACLPADRVDDLVARAPQFVEVGHVVAGTGIQVS